MFHSNNKTFDYRRQHENVRQIQYVIEVENNNAMWYPCENKWMVMGFTGSITDSSESIKGDYTFSVQSKFPYVSSLCVCMDYCNSLLYGINGYLVSQLQRCQNNAARIVSLRRKYDHLTPVLKDLHWLPVEYRINYKILLLAYKAQHGMAPPYLSSLLSPYKPGRSLRSEGKHLLTTPRYRLEGFGNRCFAHAAPSLEHAPHHHQVCPVHWHFKSNLKTHLFNIAYS